VGLCLCTQRAGFRSAGHEDVGAGGPGLATLLKHPHVSGRTTALLIAASRVWLAGAALTLTQTSPSPSAPPAPKLTASTRAQQAAVRPTAAARGARGRGACAQPPGSGSPVGPQLQGPVLQGAGVWAATQKLGHSSLHCQAAVRSPRSWVTAVYAATGSGLPQAAGARDARCTQKALFNRNSTAHTGGLV